MALISLYEFSGSDTELPKLDSFRNNYRDATKKGEPPMHVTFDILVDAWRACAHACQPDAVVAAAR